MATTYLRAPEKCWRSNENTRTGLLVEVLFVSSANLKARSCFGNICFKVFFLDMESVNVWGKMLAQLEYTRISETIHVKAL